MEYELCETSMDQYESIKTFSIVFKPGLKLSIFEVSVSTLAASVEEGTHDRQSENWASSTNSAASVTLGP